MKVVGFVASAPGFTGQPGVINGASELLGEVFGEAGRARARPRSASRCCRSDAPVEVEIVAEVDWRDRAGHAGPGAQPVALHLGGHEHLGAVRAGSSTAVVVDPGPLDEGHLAAVIAAADGLAHVSPRSC